MASLRVCEYGELPIPDANTCCPSCRQAEDLCNSTAVGHCLASRPVCGVNETSVAIPGECCESCRQSGPRCTATCASNQACLNVDGTPRCVTPQSLRLLVLWNNPAQAIATCDGSRDYVLEILRRFCVRGNNYARCLANIIVLQSLNTRRCEVAAARPALIIDIDVATVPGQNANTALTIVTEAISDSNSVGSDADSGVIASRPACNVAPESLRICDNTETPVVNISSNCYTCRPSGGRFDGNACSNSALAACAQSYSTLPVCPNGVEPTRNPTTCCFNCRPSEQRRCTDAQADLCRARYPMLRDCKLGESPVFNSTVCCLTCKIPELPRNLSGPKCSAADVDSCLLARPVCGSDEEPIFNRNTSCCGHCRRPERQCTRDDIIACSRQLPVCETGTIPRAVPSECCTSCRLAEPTCTPACADRERCVFNFTTGQAVCRVPHVVRVVLRYLNARDPKICTDTRATLLEAINRFCENADQAQRCTAARQHLRSFVGRRCTAVDDSTLTIDVESFDDSTSPSAASETTAFDALVTDAINYGIQNATDGFSASVVNQDKVRVSCTLLADQIPQCTGNSQPRFDRSTGCLSCRPSTGQACSCSQNINQIRFCTASEEPKRDTTTCCPTCIPLRNATRPTCDTAAVEACQTLVKNDGLPQCEFGESAVFNRSTCCLTCIPQPPPVNERPVANVCNATKIAACFARSPVCLDGESPIRVNNQCCPSCRSPERSCAITDVARCTAQARTCRAGERPTNLDGDCCSSCLYRPVCNCSSNQVCDNSNVTAVCRPLALTLRLIVRRKNDASALECAAAAFAFKEMIRRLCDDVNVNATRCALAHHVSDASRLLDCVRENDNTYISLDFPVVAGMSLAELRNFILSSVAVSQTGDGSVRYEIVNDDRTCTLDQTAIPVCAAGVSPVFDRSTKCYSCRSSSGRIGCTEAQVQACKSIVPPPCAVGEQPTRNDTTCCPTCRLVQAPCSNLQQQLCRGNLTQLPTCEVGAFPQFSTSTCCQDCRRDASQQEGSASVGDRCTSAQFATCLANSPLCQNGQTPQRVTGQCCPTCKRPERQCSPADVIACRASTRKCTAGELPAFTSADCCPTCIPDKGNCSATCTSPQICVPTSNNTGRCRFPGAIVRLILRNGVDRIPDCTHIVDLTQEIVNRFCEKNENAAVCDTSNVRDDIAGLVLRSCTRSGAQNETTEVALTVPSDSNSGLSRRDASSSSQLVLSAIADPDSTSGFSASNGDSTTSGSSSDANLGPIIGGTVGGAVAIVIVVALFLHYRSREAGRLNTPVVTPEPMMNPFAETSMK